MNWIMATYMAKAVFNIDLDIENYLADLAIGRFFYALNLKFRSKRVFSKTGIADGPTP